MPIMLDLFQKGQKGGRVEGPRRSSALVGLFRVLYSKEKSTANKFREQHTHLGEFIGQPYGHRIQFTFIQVIPVHGQEGRQGCFVVSIRMELIQTRA